MLKNLPEMQEIQVQSLHQEGPPENGTATHSSICLENSTEKPGKLQVMGSQSQTQMSN